MIRLFSYALVLILQIVVFYSSMMTNYAAKIHPISYLTTPVNKQNEI